MSYITESVRNCLGIMIAILCAIMTVFGFCVICGSVYLKLHLDGWKVLFRNYNPEVLFISLLSVGCVIFVLHIYGVKHGYATGYVETRESYQLFFCPLMTLMVLLAVGMCVTGVLCLVHRRWLAEGFEDGLLSRMEMYKDDMQVKTLIDKLQMNYHCCGSSSYKDWFGVSWIDKEFVNLKHPDIQSNMIKGEYFTNNAPFSCCSMKVMRPCIYHKVLDFGAHYNYEEITLNKHGCSKTLSEFYVKTILYPALCGMFGGAFVEVILVVMLRHLQTSIQSADLKGQPAGYGNATCCVPLPYYNPNSSRMMERRGYMDSYEGWDRNINANIRNSISYIEDVILNQPKPWKSHTNVPLAEKKTNDKSKTTKTSTTAKSGVAGKATSSKCHKNVPLAEKKANDKSKIKKTSTIAKSDAVKNTKPSKSDKVVILNDHSKTSNIHGKKWLRKRNICTNGSISKGTKTSIAENGVVRNASPSNSDNVGCVAEVTTNDKTSNIRKKKWLRRRNSSKDNNTIQDTEMSATPKNDAARNANPSNIDNVGRLAEAIANDQNKTSNIRKKKWLRRRDSSKDNTIDKDTKTSTVDGVEEEIANDQTSNIRTKNWLGQRNSSKDNNTNQNTHNSSASENEEIRNPKPPKRVHFADEVANYQHKTNSQKEMLLTTKSQ